MSLLEQGWLSELDVIGNDELLVMVGKLMYEIKIWVVVFVVLFVFGCWCSEGCYYWLIFEWIVGFGLLSVIIEI